MKRNKYSLGQESIRLEHILKHFKFVDREGNELLNKERNLYMNTNRIKIYNKKQSIRGTYMMYNMWLKQIYADVLISEDKKIHIDKYELFKED